MARPMPSLHDCVFPCAATSAAPVRGVAIPTAFGSVAQYRDGMAAALVEEVNLRMMEAAQPFHRAVQQLQQQQQQRQQQHQPAPRKCVQQLGLDCGPQLEKLCVQVWIHTCTCPLNTHALNDVPLI